MTQVTKVMRLVLLAAGFAALTAFSQPVEAATGASCGEPNVCCGEHTDLACGAIVTAAIGHCCGAQNAQAMCFSDVFWVYCDSPVGRICNCNATGDNCISNDPE